MVLFGLVSCTRLAIPAAVIFVRHFTVNQVGLCSGGNSPQNNAGLQINSGLQIYYNADCKALCAADPGCTGYAVAVDVSDPSCGTYTSVGISGNGDIGYMCFVK